MSPVGKRRAVAVIGTLAVCATGLAAGDAPASAQSVGGAGAATAAHTSAIEQAGAARLAAVPSQGKASPGVVHPDTTVSLAEDSELNRMGGAGGAEAKFNDGVTCPVSGLYEAVGVTAASGRPAVPVSATLLDRLQRALRWDGSLPESVAPSDQAVGQILSRSAAGGTDATLTTWPRSERRCLSEGAAAGRPRRRPRGRPRPPRPPLCPPPRPPRRRRGPRLVGAHPPTVLDLYADIRTARIARLGCVPSWLTPAVSSG